MESNIPIQLIAHYRLKEGVQEAFFTLFSQVAQYTQQEPGNLVYRSFTDPNQPNHFFILEAYTDQAAVEAHRNSWYFNDIVIAKLVPMLEKREVFTVTEHQF